MGRAEREFICIICGKTFLRNMKNKYQDRLEIKHDPYEEAK